jgi:DNA-binding NarL/FixJ family response regulator
MTTLQHSFKKTIPTLLIAITDKLKAELISTLESKKIFKSVGVLTDGENLFEILETRKPDYLLIENNFPKNQSFGFLKKLTRIKPETKVIIYSNFINSDYLKVFLSSPAIGYIQHGCTIIEFLSYMKNIFEGKNMIFSQVGDFKRHDFSKKESDCKNFALDLSLLTEREMDVWELVMESKSENEIANILYISPNTVKTHKSNISTKLNLKNKIRLSKLVVDKQRRIY